MAKKNSTAKLQPFRRHLCTLIGSVLLFTSTGFAADEAPADSAQLEFFEKQIRPLLVTHCYECHSAADVNGGLRLDTRAGISKGGDSGPVISGDMSGTGSLVSAVQYSDRNLQMPPSGKLSDQQITLLKTWAQMGAPHPADPSDPLGASTTATAAPSGMSIKEGRQFWSLRPISDPQIPTVANNNWVTNPIDAFISHQHEATGLIPAAKADRRTLIRRVTFDLTGLPPSIEDIDAFLADKSDTAFDDLVDRLLASPQYGVQWGRHWLDVARYADSNGLDENIAFGNAWRYRDYVIQSFNEDKPFDRFLTEQLAGDLLPDADTETRTATGFLVLGAKVLAEPDMEKLVMDTVDEQLDTIGKAFMGMTIGCCRCHDHKFDPLKQSDYYALAAIFKSTKTFSGGNTGAIKYWNEHSFATPEDKEALKKVDAEIAAKKKLASAFNSSERAKIRTEAESKAADYLFAATRFTAATAFSDVKAVADELGLHARILHHCRLHLEYNQSGFFSKWHRLQVLGESTMLRRYYTALIAAALDPESKTADADKFSAADLQDAKVAVKDKSGFLAVPPKADFAFDSETLQEYFRLETEARLIESQAADEESVMAVSDQKILASLPIHIRGSHVNLGVPVNRNFPEVMRPDSMSWPLTDSQSGRLELAKWLTGDSHPLTARVFVNRVWNWHFGRGIVETTENFGKLGGRPSHPELLDWLAVEFKRSGWSVKHLHRLILRSNTWQMSSVAPASGHGQQVDPENSLLWKFPIRRLSAEQIRDSLLVVSARLDTSIGGKTVPLRNRQFVFNHTSRDHTKYDSLRRAAFLPVIRNNLYTFFEQFDFPDPTMPTGRRNNTTVAPQTLLIMNSELVMDSADEFAERLFSMSSDDAQRIDFAYQLAFGRVPTAEESAQAIAFIHDPQIWHIDRQTTSAAAELRAWSTFCHSLFASNEFLYLK